MKRLFLALTGWFLCLALQAQTPQYTFQYWFDGHYDARITSMNATGTWQTQMEISHLSEGFHTLYLHFRDTSGQWSSPRSFLFYRTPASVADSGINYAYWFDKNYGGHVSDTTAGNLIVDVSHLSDGFHTLNLRTGKKHNDRLQSFLFYKLPTSAADTTAYYAYWFDQNHRGRVDGSTGGTVIVDVTSLSDGFHTLNIQTGEGHVAKLQSFLFYKMPAFTPDSLGLHYYAWFNNDLDNSQEGNLRGGHLLLDVTNLRDGLNTLNLQLGLGDVIMLKSALFYKMTVMDSSDMALNYACWFDQDYENRRAGDIGNGGLLFDVGDLDDGFHTVNLQFGGGRGAALQSFLFYKMPVADTGVAHTYTCWFDHDYDNRTSGSISGGIMLLNVAELKDGFHNFNLQLGDGSNASLQSWLFYKVPNSGVVNDSSVLTWHYSIDGREQTPIEVSPTNGLIHLELDIADFAPGLHTMSHYMTASNGSVDAARTSLFYRSGTGIDKYEYWYNDTDSAKTIVNTLPADTLRLITMLQVPQLPIRSTCFEFDPNDGEPVIYAKNQVTFRFWTGDSRFIDRTSDYVDIYTRDTVIADTLERNTTRTIASPSGNKIHWFKLEAGPGDSLVFNTNRGCAFQLFAPSGEEVLKAEGTEAIAGRGCHVWEDGVYYLAVHQAGTEADSLKVTYQWIYKYAVLAHSPDIASNAPSMITLHLSGNGLDKISSAILFNTDTAWIMDTVLIATNSEAFINFFVTNSIQLGYYNLLLEFVDESNMNDTIIVDSMLNIMQADYGEIVITYDFVSSFTEPHIINVNITNTGNIPYLGIPIVFAYTKPDVSNLEFPSYYLSIDSLDNIDSMYHNADNLFGKGVQARYLPFIMSKLEPYQTLAMQVEFNCPRGQSFDFYAWAGKPWSSVNFSDVSEQESKASIFIEQHSKASSTGRDICDMPDPCDIAGAAECLCGVSNGTIKALAGAMGSKMLKGMRDAQEWARNEGYEGDIYGELPQLQSPSSILRQAMEHCTPEQAQAATAALYAAWDALDGEDCPDPTPLHPTVPSPPVDPNDITGYLAKSGSRAIKQDIFTLPYVIEFENDPAFATSSAVRVEVRDTLDANIFDLSTFSATGVTIGDRKLVVNNKKSFIATIDMRPDVNCVAQVTMDFDTVTGIAAWQFTSLNPMTLNKIVDPKQGLLPVNAGTNGIGTVTFTINRKASTHDGDSIFNRASIVFDNEDAILTPTWVNIVDDIDPVSSISNAVTIEDSTILYFNGSDNRSGIWRYTLYGRQDTTQEWSIVANNIEESHYQVANDNDMEYYMVSATDSAGNREVKSIEGDFSTTQGVATYYTVTAAANGWQGVASGSGRIREYRNATLTAIPSYGYHFSAWSDGDTNNPRTITVMKDTTLTALFDINRYSIEATSSDWNTGTVNGGGQFEYQTMDTLTAIAAAHHHFIGWSDGNTDNPRFITVTRDSTLTALFAIDTHSVTLIGDGELVALSGSGSYPYGTQVTVSATMLSLCHSFEAWNSNGNIRDTTLTYSFEIDGDIEMTAVCEVNIYNGTEEKTACLSHTWNGNTYTESGSYQFSTVNANGCDSLATLILTIDNPKRDTVSVETCDGYAWNGANYTSSGLYAKVFHPTTAGLCDSTAILDLTVKYSTSGEESISSCENFTWHDNNYQVSGSYNRTLTGANGCDSIATLHLTINQPTAATIAATACESYTWHGNTYMQSGSYTHHDVGSKGCDSTTTLQLTINHATTGTEDVTANDSYLWHGTTYVESGNYTWLTQNAAGCDSTAILRLIIHYSTTGNEVVAACSSHTWHGTTYSQSGVYTFDTTNVSGADSTVTLYLTINHPTSGTETVTACDSYTWHGNEYTQSGNYTYHTTGSKGCDSTATLLLFIKRSSTSIEQATACESFYWHGTEYTSSNNSATYTTTNAAGCDSTVTLNLTVNHVSFGTETITACDNYDWFGQTLNHNGNYNHVVANAAGCDSLVTLYLTLKQSSSGSEAVTACESYTWHGNTFTTSGNQTWQTTNAVGCDSTATLLLTINHANTGIETVTACDSFTWHGNTYQASTNMPVYVTTNQAGCDSTVSLRLTVNYSSHQTETLSACDSYIWHGVEYNSSTSSPMFTYTNVKGCDSIVTLHLTVNHSNTGIETVTACDSYTWHGNTFHNSTASPTFTSTNVAGCDSVTTLNLTINHSNAAIENVTACDSYIWHGTEYTASTNDATFSSTNAAGCDSVTMLHLIINQSSTGIAYATACDRYTWHGVVYTESTNTPTFTRSNSYGCDSIITLNLTVNYSNSAVESITACDSYTWHGTVYQESTDTPVFTSLNSVGCDSTTTLLLTINNSNSAVENITACNSYVWHGTEYTASTNTPTFTSTNAAGCDSVTTLILDIQHCSTTEITACNSYSWHGNSYSTSGTYVDGTDTLVLYVKHSSSGVENVTACDSYTWHGTTYTASTNTPTYMSMQNVVGCDSIVTLNLTIKNSTSGIESVVACNSYIWHGTLYDSSTNTPSFTSMNSMGCDSVTTLHLTIKHSTSGEETISVCDSYTWHGDTYTESGYYEWPQSGDISLNAAGCDSTTTLYLTVNHSTIGTETITACDSYTWHGTEYSVSTNSPTFTSTNTMGCDSVTTLHLTINYSSAVVENANACNRYVWHGNVYTTPTNTATFTTVNSLGCDSITYLHLTLNYTSYGVEEVTACDIYNWHGTEYTSSTHTPTFTSINTLGCDSVTTLHLTMNYSSSGIETITACDSYTWHGSVFTMSSGTNTFTSTNSVGCDSVTTLHLTINYSTESTDNVTACDSYSWHGVEYTSSTNTPTITSTNAFGCNHQTTLNLTVNYSSVGIEDVTACDSFIWHGTEYNASTNTPTFTSMNTAGCDSVTTLNLTINSSNEAVETITACNSYIWHGIEYTASTNTPTFTTLNAVGCDSVTTLNLAIQQCSTTEIITCDSYTWNGMTYTSSGIYFNGTDTLLLTVNQSTVGVENVSSCDNYTWHGATYAESGNYTYQTTNATGCDSTVTLNLTILFSTSGVDNVIACNSYVWHGTEYTASTNTPTFTTLNAVGCDSVTTLNLVIQHCSTVEITACDSYTWHGSSYTTSGIYTDGTDTLLLTINNSNTGIEIITACDSYTWYGTEYTTSNNTATYTTTNAAGCDSVVTLNLTVNYSNTGVETVMACNSYIWHGTEYTTSNNTATYTTTNAAGCDSVVTLNLTVNYGTTSVETVMACDSYTWHGTDYTTDNNTATFTTTNAAGCDSVVTLNLTVNYSTTGVESVTACDSYDWHGTIYTSSNSTATFMTTTAAGCDSVVTLNLTVNYSNNGVETVTACDSFTWHGNIYTTSNNTAIYSTTNAAGCDSVVTLNLTVNYSTTGVETVNACDSYDWNGNSLTESGEYTYTTTNAAGCDSTVTLNLTVNYSVSTFDTLTISNDLLPYEYNGITINGTGDYTLVLSTLEGCDSTVLLYVQVATTSIDDVSYIFDISIYPNPTNGMVTIVADKVLHVDVLDIVGRKVSAYDDTLTIDLSNLPDGSYILRITTPHGTAVRKVTKK